MGRDRSNWSVIAKCISKELVNGLSDIFIDDITVSNEHLRIYSIAYDPSALDIDAFVYAQDLSSNGSDWIQRLERTWRTYPIGKSNAFLISDGDEINLRNGISLAFVLNCSEKQSGPKDIVNERQEFEKEASHPLPEF